MKSKTPKTSTKTAADPPVPQAAMGFASADVGEPDPGTELRPDRLGGELRPDRLGAPLRPDRLGALAREVPAWRLTENASLLRTWTYPNATTAACFARFVAALAEAAGHPAVIRQHHGRVTVRLTTPRVGGLTERDFQLAQQLGARA